MDKQKIDAMTIGGKILGEVLLEVTSSIVPGMTEIEIDQLADKLIREKGGEAGFKKVYGYKYATCISTNDVVVHGIPTSRVLQEGDIIGVDCGVFYNEYHTDMSETIKIKSNKEKIKNEEETDRFLITGKKALVAGISQARVGNRVGHISHALQSVIEKGGYSIVKNLVGHGIGRDLHEKPEIPGYLAKKIENTPLLREGMTIAIEVIYNQGSDEVMYRGDDGWTIITSDGKLSGVFERTLLLTTSGPRILTNFGNEHIV